MSALPSRDGLAALASAVNAVAPLASLGFTRHRADGRASVVFSYPFGLGEYIVPAVDVPDVMRSDLAGVRQADAVGLKAKPSGAIEWLLLLGGAERVASIAIAGVQPATRFWAGFPDPSPLRPDQLMRLESIARASAEVLNAPRSPEETTEHSRRLECAADLLPALLHVLDVRDVFDRLSEIARQALPHDLCLLGLFDDELTKLTMYARSDRGSELDPTLPHQYPASVTEAWEFDIIDDYAIHPLERNRPPAKMGARSALRLPIRFDDRVIGGVGFFSFDAGKYTTADVAIGRRLADQVAVGLSHYRLAEQSRHAAALRERAANLEMLDGLLETLTGVLDIREGFGRVSMIARKILTHDAAALMVRLADGHHARLYASSGFPPGLPEIAEIPEELLAEPNWESNIIDDLRQFTGADYLRLVEMGFHSLLRVPIRLADRFAGALIFLSNSGAAFNAADVPVARRIAERMAVTLARDRVIEASRRADEAAERASRLEARVRALTEELDSRTGYRRVVGESAGWRQALTQATQVAPTETTVLLLGESGTGKEVVARFLHRASSRSNGPFIALNCAALPEQLLEAELFGYERGAYTGATQSKPGQLELASGGTLFLDEVAEMSPSSQAKFLRVLQEREFQRLGGTRVLRTEARIVAATNRDLRRAIANEHFREDLYYRLNVFAIELPALRSRRDDILPLSEVFLKEIGRGLGRPPAGISREARQQLIDYHWPGNVRELRNILERAAILCDGGLIVSEHLAISTPLPAASPSIQFNEVAGAAALAATGIPASAGDLQLIERAMIEQALQTARFNKSKAAKALGMTRHQLYIRMRKHGFE